jgi:dehydrodolichyl diphosphate syntase complex subunit NUS1
LLISEKCVNKNNNAYFIYFLGILKHQLSSDFHKLIQKQLKTDDNENVVFGPEYQTISADGSVKFPHRNGYKKHIIVNLYSSRDSYEKFNNLLSKHDINRFVDSESVTIENVDEKLCKLHGNMPDPELALYFGNYCHTAGFFPWQTRLTEFMQISYKLHHLSLDKFIRVLYRYAKCEQRYGK